MEYYLLDENNQQIGPFSLNQIKSKKIKRTDKIWRPGMNDWADAITVPELKSFFESPPPKSPVIGNSQQQQQRQQQHSQNFSSYHIYDEHFNVNRLNKDQKDFFSRHEFSDTMEVGLGIFLHYITLGIFTFIFCGIKHSYLPKITEDDFDGGKAIGFCFIPFFNFYWIFVFWRKLAQRINLQYKLRGERSPVSLGLATAVCVLHFIPYIGNFTNWLVLKPILFHQIQTASNRLANENIGAGFYEM